MLQKLEYRFLLAIFVLSVAVSIGVSAAFNHLTEKSASGAVIAAESNVSAIRNLEDSFTSLASKVSPAVVSITAERRPKFSAAADDFFQFFPFGFSTPRSQRDRSEPRPVGGSGVIVRPDGYILTNDHVVGGAEKVTVTLTDGTEYNGKVLRDYASDLAVVKVEAKDLPTVPLSDSSKVKVGQWAIAIGSPFRLSNTLTVGVVSALEREQVIPDPEAGPGQGRYYASLIQTDAAINPGNSGGPLMNIDGQIIGINVAIESPSGANAGIGFAIPSNTAKFVLEQLISKGRVVRGYLGLRPDDIRPAIAGEIGVSKGARVIQVDDNTPASDAGINVDDVIVEFNGKSIENALELRDVVARTEPGTKVTIVVVRDKQRKTLTATVGEAPDRTPGASEVSSEGIGINVRPLTPETRKESGIDEKVSGVFVSSVNPGSAAARAGIQRGDVIVKIGGTNVTSVDSYNQAIRRYKSGSLAMLQIRRGNSTVSVTLEIP